LEGTLKVIWLQPPCHEQGHLLLDQVAPIDPVGELWTRFWKCAGLLRIQKVLFLSRLFQQLRSQILGYLVALCCVGSDNQPELPETAWTETGVKAGPQISYCKGTSNPAKLSALKELQRKEGKF